MRIKLVSRALCGLLAVGTLLMAGCSRLPSVTLDQLMEEVNAAHQAIGNDSLKQQFILRQPVDENGAPISETQQYSYFTTDLESYDLNLVLTREQALEDVTYLFDALYACYGNYDRMGGRAAFDAAERAVLEECSQVDSISAQDLQALMLSHLSFVKDAHFQIQNQSPSPLWYPFFFREMAFYLDDGQYITADHKTMASVDGYDDLTQVFRRSISPEGEIVYYPVVLKDTTTCDESLTVHYTDGTTQVLHSEPCDYSDRLDQVLSLDRDAVPSLRDDNGIPVLQVNGMDGASEWGEVFLDGAETLGNSKVSILDLRCNPGGKQTFLEDWLKTYAKTQVPANSLFRNAFSGEQLFPNRDKWVENDRLLIILTGKYTASGSEWLIDAAYNLENVLLIGENTYGSLIGSSVTVQLKNSKLVAKVGILENIVPSTNGYFEECRGFYPDLWVPAGEAEELAVKLLEQNAK